MIDPERVDDQVLSACDFLVIGTPVYLGEMLIKKWLRQNEKRLRSKRLFLFVVCTHFSDSEKQQTMIKDNIPDSIRGACELHFFPGRLCIESLTPEDARSLDIGTPSNPHRSQKNMGASYFPVNKESIAQLMESVRQQEVNRGDGNQA